MYGDCSHHVCSTDRLPLRPAVDRPHLPDSLDPLARVLRSLESCEYCVSLLQGYHHIAWTFSAGTLSSAS